MPPATWHSESPLQVVTCQMAAVMQVGKAEAKAAVGACALALTRRAMHRQGAAERRADAAAVRMLHRSCGRRRPPTIQLTQLGQRWRLKPTNSHSPRVLQSIRGTLDGLIEASVYGAAANVRPMRCRSFDSRRSNVLHRWSMHLDGSAIPYTMATYWLYFAIEMESD